MKQTTVLFLALFAGALSAAADPNDLSGGVLITHYVQGLAYSADVSDWAAAYAPYAITSSQNQSTRINGPLDNAVWYVLGAWNEPKVWRGVAFGFANYTAAMFSFYYFGPCYPSAGGLELPTSGWPGPNQGTAIVGVGTTGSWSGNYVPLYCFAGYAYGPGQGSTIIQIGVEPATGSCEFSNMQNPPQLYPVTTANRGGLGINANGVAVHPVYTAPERVCCNPTTYACTIKTEADCAAAGGIWKPSETLCAPVNPCIPLGACCWGTAVIRCDVYSEAVCLTKPHPIHGQGIWQGEGVPCNPNPCVVQAERVCCLPDESCQILSSAQCSALGGTWHESYSTCDDAHCDALGACCINTVCRMVWEAECKVLNGMPPEQPFVPGRIWHPRRTCAIPDNPCFGTPVQEATWGRIKSLYR